MSDSDLEKALDSFQKSTELFKKSLFDYRSSASDNDDITRLDQPLNALADIASLCHAHTTKIGISFQLPISVSAAVKCVQDAASLTSLFVGTYTGMSNELDGKLVMLETRKRIYNLFESQVLLISDLKNAMETNKEYVKLTEEQGKDKSNSQSRKPALLSIGKVWECCDALKLLPMLNTEGLISSKLTEYASMIQDAAEDLKMWIEDEGLEDDLDFGLSDSDDDRDEEKEIPPSKLEKPVRSPELESLASRWLDKLRKLDLLYKAICKRRCSKLSLQDANALYELVHFLSSQIDELVSSFIENCQPPELSRFTKAIDEQVKNLISIVNSDRYRDKDSDVFTKWVDLFIKNFY